MGKSYVYHDIANGYPMATTAEFAMLKQSIADRGQQTPIVLFEDKILDGRNRYRACLELEIEPVIEVFTGSYDDAVAYSHELNSGRRNLDKSQKAMVAAYDIERSRHDEGVSKITIKQASLIYSVSEKYIKRALRIVHEDINIAEQVFNGYETIGAAEKRLEIISKKQQEIETILHDVARDKSVNMDTNMSDTYAYLYGKDKVDLIDIIIRSGIL